MRVKVVRLLHHEPCARTGEREQLDCAHLDKSGPTLRRGQMIPRMRLSVFCEQSPHRIPGFQTQPGWHLRVVRLAVVVLLTATDRKGLSAAIAPVPTPPGRAVSSRSSSRGAPPRSGTNLRSAWDIQRLRRAVRADHRSRYPRLLNADPRTPLRIA